jgi:hypothetical protein
MRAQVGSNVKKGKEIKKKEKKKNSKYQFLRKIIKSRRITKKINFVFGNSLVVNRVSVVRVCTLECGCVVRLKESGKRNKNRKSVICPWCAAGERRQ